MKVIASGLLGLASTFLLCLLLGMFITWNPDPAEWSMEGRVVLVFLSVCGGLFAGMAEAEQTKSKWR